jgi:Ca2+-binding EF-hand superfamily protein
MPPKATPAAQGKATATNPSKGKKKCSVSDADARNLQKTFAEYDVDGSGEISLLELQHFFEMSSPDL